jgi:ferritin
MMLSKAVQDALNEQINKEFFSAYLYLAMSAHFASVNLPGLAKWTRVQFEEEMGHALKLYDYVIERGSMVNLAAVEKPASVWKTSLEVFNQVYEHEQKVTASIHKVYEVALKENDYATQVMLQWFINEQVEEEKNASEIVAQLKMVEARETAILMLDHRLGKRGGDD